VDLEPAPGSQPPQHPSAASTSPVRSATCSLWWATRNEWLGLVDVAGLELEALYGGFAHEPFADDSQEYVFVTRRRRRPDPR
jgi:hypothetical protein